MPGQPAVAADVLTAGARLLAALRDDGHALAKMDPPIADLDLAAEAVDVDFEVNAGPLVSIGTISVDGLSALNESYIRRRLTLKSGTVYSPAALETARADLAKVPIIASVRLAPGQEVAADGTLPVDVVLSERKPRAVSLSAAYSTDQGGNTTATWSHRNLFGNAEVLTLSAGLTDIGATAAKQPGYKMAGLLTLPDWRERDQSLDITALAVRESLDAYDRTAAIAGVTFNRRLSAHWIASIGLFGEDAHFVQDAVGRDYHLLQVPLGLHYNTTTSLIDPAAGTRVDAMLTPTESIGHPNATFTIAQVSAAQFFDLAAPGRSVLALRGLIGTVEGASTFAIPPDQRFYGGGSGTIRGYRYQSVGPELSNGKPSGGSAMSAGTVEFRQRFGADWGGALFVDAGQVSTTSTPFNGQFRAGVGIGVRYYTSIGPLRADVAIPLIHQNNSDPVEFYIGLGQAF
jgi:translocation and assembly module TamA